MKQETRASRGAMAGLELSAVAADEFVDTAKPLDLQARRITARLKCSPAVAAVYAAHAYELPENWRRA